MRQFMLTPAAGKRLLGKALAVHPEVRRVLASGTLVIVAGTTNGYVAEEILRSIGQAEGFSRGRFMRGVTLPPGRPVSATGRPADESGFPGDVVVVKGSWNRGATIFDVVEDLEEGDLVIKGANALDLARRQAAVYIGDRKAGTVGAALLAAAGRRVGLFVAVGLEKRVQCDLVDVASRLNAPGSTGPRLLPVPGVVFTEIDALAQLSGAAAELIAAGGVGGAEGCVWLGVSGTDEQLAAAEAVLQDVASEPLFDAGHGG